MAETFTREDVQKLIDDAVRPLKKRIAELEEENAQLRAHLGKNSSNSSKPPSSDIVKPPKKKHLKRGDKKKRKAGGQPGHEKQSRASFTPEQVDKTYIHEWKDAGDLWEPLDDFSIHQQVELRDNPLHITEHRLRRYRHRRSGRVITTPMPRDLRGTGLFGPRLRGLTAMLKGELHASCRGIQKLYRDGLGLEVSTGYLMKVVRQTSDALCSTYEQLLDMLPTEPVLGMDETGHPDSGDKLWLWTAVGKTFSVFKVASNRGSEVIRGLLGLSYDGVLLTDFHSAYKKYVKDAGGVCLPSYCWAHLVREIKYLATLSDKVTKAWAEKLLSEVRKLFKAYHEQGPRAQANAKQAVLKRVKRPPKRGEVVMLATRIREQSTAYFRFLDRSDVEPTNNRSERALRHAVLHRKMTQGTRGDMGQRWCERFLTVRETCRQQERSLFDLLVEAITCHANGQQAPLMV